VPNAYGNAPVVGTSLSYAREDHDHGLPFPAFVGVLFDFGSGGSQSIPDGGAGGQLTMAAPGVDTDGFWSAGAPGDIVMPFTGLYFINGIVNCDAATTVLDLGFKKTGSGVDSVQQVVKKRVGGGRLYNLSAGNVLQAFVSQTSGGAQNVLIISLSVEYRGVG
jgi:hypothetical protein